MYQPPSQIPGMRKFAAVILTLISLMLSMTAVAGTSGTESDSVITDLNGFCARQNGFNLLGKFDVSWNNAGYAESEFSMIHELGFNFVRLPVDFRTYTQSGNWDLFIESEVQEIDKAIQWGEKYDVHVCLNLHRAPGYCVNASTLPVNQDLDLWTNPVAQEAFVNHWIYFANRYKDIPSSRLSFNLVNEPSGVTEADYVKVMKMAIDAIHTISPQRIIFVDGLNYGSDIITTLKDEPYVAQALHCYQPFGLTHYKAEWAEGSDTWPVPQWPVLEVSKYLYGPGKSEFQSPLIVQGDFPAGTEITVNVQQVSIESQLEVKADGSVVYDKHFVCGPDTGDDFSVVVESQWGYQNISNKDFSCTLSKSTSELSFSNIAGDWMTVNFITIKSGEAKATLVFSDNTWGRSQDTYLFRDGTLKTAGGENLLPFGNYLSNINLARDNGIPVMVQEFGVYNKTPYDVTLRFLSDLIDFFNEQRIGRAIWNFDGTFGILNSGRTDCPYTDFHGNQLDKGMLDILAREAKVTTDYVFDTVYLEALGKNYEIGPAVTEYQDKANLSGNTSVRNVSHEELKWKTEGYFQRNRDLGQIFIPKKDTWVKSIVIRTGPAESAVLYDTPGSKVFLQFFDISGDPVINDNGTPKGTESTHGFNTNHRTDDYIEGVEYHSFPTIYTGFFPSEVPVTKDEFGNVLSNAGRLYYIRWTFREPVFFEANHRYGFMMGMMEPGLGKGFTLANANEAANSAVPSLDDAYTPYKGGWAFRREGDGTLPPSHGPWQ